jgi:site-specific recombinase XerD
VLRSDPTRRRWCPICTQPNTFNGRYCSSAAAKRSDLTRVDPDLPPRHSFGTAMAGQGVPMRVLQELMGHRDFSTTLIYADYSPSAHEARH